MAAEYLECPRLGGSVEFTEERRVHVASRHLADVVAILANLGSTLLDPDTVRQSRDNPSEFFIARKVDLGSGTKHIVVIVVRQDVPARPWIVTAFVARRLPGGQRWIAI